MPGRLVGPPEPARAITRLFRRVSYNLHSFRFAGDFILSLLSRLRKGPEKAAGLRWELVELPCGPEVSRAVRVDEETYRRHLDAKRYEPRAIRRRVVWEWTKRSSRWPDHLLDCEVTQIAWAAFHDRLPLNLPEEKGQNAVGLSTA